MKYKLIILCLLLSSPAFASRKRAVTARSLVAGEVINSSGQSTTLYVGGLSKTSDSMCESGLSAAYAALDAQTYAKAQADLPSASGLYNFSLHCSYTYVYNSQTVSEVRSDSYDDYCDVINLNKVTPGSGESCIQQKRNNCSGRDNSSYTETNLPLTNIRIIRESPYYNTYDFSDHPECDAATGENTLPPVVTPPVTPPVVPTLPEVKPPLSCEGSFALDGDCNAEQLSTKHRKDMAEGIRKDQSSFGSLVNGIVEGAKDAVKEIYNAESKTIKRSLDSQGEKK